MLQLSISTTETQNMSSFHGPWRLSWVWLWIFRIYTWYMGIFIIVQDPTWFGSNFFLLQPNLRMKLDSDKLRQSFHVSNYVWNLQREMLKPNSQACAVIPRVRVSANRLDLSSNLCTFEKWKNILINRQRPIQRHIHTHTHGHTVSKFKNLIWMFQCLSFSA